MINIEQARRNHRATGLPTGRAPGCFLDRDGYEAAAEHIKRRLLACKGPHVVDIRKDGGVRITARWELSNDEHTARATSPAYVGTYNRTAMTEHIEDDLIHWMREQSR